MKEMLEEEHGAGECQLGHPTDPSQVGDPRHQI
jgi:hypothetical protein